MEGWSEQISPFHSGEQVMHDRLGIRDRQEAMGRRMMRRFMPDQHREFFAQLPFIILGSVDITGAPWASILQGTPGFVGTPTDRSMRINATPLPGDPLHDGLAQNAPVSLLGIEPHTRRRNRANLLVNKQDVDGIDLRLTMSFGNCPQYIQNRLPDLSAAPNDPVELHVIDHLTLEVQALITKSDTFFVASHNDRDDPETIGGVDVNHRGGKPGFVRVDGNTLTIPDFRGNNAFNTLGNFLVNPRAGLLFLDFETGDVLQMTGSTAILHEANAAQTGFDGALRSWTFTFERGHILQNAIPSGWRFRDYAQQLDCTGQWPST